MGLMVSKSVNLCDWDRYPPQGSLSRRQTCAALFIATITDPRDVDEKAALVLLDAWESAGFPLRAPRYFKRGHVSVGRSVWRLPDGEMQWPPEFVEVTLGSYNNKWWFPVEPHP